jgi:hypothetical protein
VYALLVAACAALAGCSSSGGPEGPAAAPDAQGPGPEPDAAAPADAGADARCFVVDDAGVTHGCGQGSQGPGDRDDGGDAGPPPIDASPDAHDLPFGAECLDNAQCASGICYDYRVKGQFCTKFCNTNADCPAPSNQCNGMGVCRMGS